MANAAGLSTHGLCPAGALALMLAFGSGDAVAQSIFTVAGGGTDDGRPATLSALIDPFSVDVDAAGHLYFSDQVDSRIRRVDGSTGLITTVAGSGISGFSGDGEAATKASFHKPQGIAVDDGGNVYVADSENDRIRMVDAVTGIVTSIAGCGVPGFGGDGGPATEASLKFPEWVALDRFGDLYVSDRYNFRVRRVDAATGIITTIAGNGSHYGFSGDGGPATKAPLPRPGGLALDGSGNLFVADPLNRRVRRVDGATGIITTVAGNGEWIFNGDGRPATEAALVSPSDVALDEEGNLYISDSGDWRVRRVDAVTGIITTIAGNGEWAFAGDGGPATEASFDHPQGIVLDEADNLYVADEWSGRVRRVDAVTGIITTFAGGGRKFTGDEGPATQASLTWPVGAAFDASGNLYVADAANDRIRRIDVAMKDITTVAGSGMEGFSGDGGPATAASMYRPQFVAVDANGSLFISDTSNHRVRRVDGLTGVITTVAGGGSASSIGDGGPATAASFSFSTGVALDAAGNLYVADRYNNRVRRVDGTTGIITTVAGGGSLSSIGDGGPATEADLTWPEGIALDGAENLYIADSHNNRIRKVDRATGVITTVAGNGRYLFAGDGGPATEASLNTPHDVAVDDGGNLYIADQGHDRIRRVDGVTGIITTLAGDGAEGFSGDGGPATRASLALDCLNCVRYSISGGGGVAVDDEGNAYVIDSTNHRVRVVFRCVDVGNPTLVTPSNGSQGLATFPALGWERTTGAFRYDLYVDVVSPLRRRVAIDIETSTFSPANLEPLTTYYWKVVAKGDPFCDPFRTAESAVWSFTTESACEAPGDLGTSGPRDLGSSGSRPSWQISWHFFYHNLYHDFCHGKCHKNAIASRGPEVPRPRGPEAPRPRF